MSYVLAIMVVFAAGCLAAMQSAVNSRLGQLLGSPFQASFVSFVLGTIVLFLLLIVTRESLPSAQAMAKVSPLYYIGGVCGAVLVTVFIMFVPRVGVVNVLLFALAGQVTASVLIDHFALLGVRPQPVDLWRIGGLLLIGIGVLVLNRRHLFPD